jgi:release factor glutamine methyltransferase
MADPPAHETAAPGEDAAMRRIVLPGVFQPRSDTWLLAAVGRSRAAGGRVLELCAGPALAGISSVLGGGGSLTSVDVSRRAVLNARLNARLNGVAIDARRGDLLDAVAGERFDLILANPPYVPGPDPADRGPERATDAGADGRVFLDRICARVAGHLNPGGSVLLVQSEVSGVDATLTALERAGLGTDVVASRRGPLGPLLSARREQLEARGLLRRGQEFEDVMVVEGLRVGRTDGDA